MKLKYKYKVVPSKSNPPIECIKDEYGMKDNCVCKVCWTEWWGKGKKVNND